MDEIKIPNVFRFYWEVKLAKNTDYSQYIPSMLSTTNKEEERIVNGQNCIVEYHDILYIKFDCITDTFTKSNWSLTAEDFKSNLKKKFKITNPKEQIAFIQFEIKETI